MNEPYNTLNHYWREKFGGIKVRKIAINAGFDCPNKDGTFSKIGCIFCDYYGSGPIKTFNLTIEEQIEFYMKNHKNCKYIAYYQAHTNTYAPAKILREKYSKIFKYKEIVGLYIGTRPDSISKSAYNVLDEFNKKTYLGVELGLQSVHEKSLKFLNRNHTYDDFLRAFFKLKELNIETIVHLIIGIPGEDKEDIFKTIEEMNRIKPDGIKFHLFHVLKGTPLYEMHLKEPFKLMEEDIYINLMVDILRNLDKDIVIHRLTGERDEELFYAPQWAKNKIKTINQIRDIMIKNNYHQGYLS